MIGGPDPRPQRPADPSQADPHQSWFDRIADRRQDRLRSGFRKSQQSPTPTWVYGLALAAMLAVLAVLAVYSGTR
jgi:hypothetical protein